MRNMRECYEAYNNGDKLTDMELYSFWNHMETTTGNLVALGPEFKIAANHCRQIAQTCDGYIRARELDRKIRPREDEVDRAQKYMEKA